MKNQTLLFMLLACLFGAHHTRAQAFEEKTNKTIQLPRTDNKMLISIQNLKGFVMVETHKGKTVEFEIEKIVTGDTQADVELGKQENNIVIEERTDTVITHISSPFARWKGYKYGNINFSGEDEYSFKFNIKVRVPEGVSLDVASNGEVRIADVKGNIEARAHQGLKLQNIAGRAQASAHHGDMEVSYVSPIPANSSFHTHHGDIRLSVPGKPDADIYFDSYHGEFFTEFTDVQILPAQVNTSVSKDDDGKSYKIEKKKALRLGKGGITLDFKSHHGNFYLISRKQ
jgi:hypothetical protein